MRTLAVLAFALNLLTAFAAADDSPADRQVVTVAGNGKDITVPSDGPATGTPFRSRSESASGRMRLCMFAKLVLMLSVEST